MPESNDVENATEKPSSWTVRCQLEQRCRDMLSDAIDGLSSDNYAASMRLLQLMDIIQDFSKPK